MQLLRGADRDEVANLLGWAMNGRCDAFFSQLTRFWCQLWPTTRTDVPRATLA
jgi:hypothetical protein